MPVLSFLCFLICLFLLNRTCWDQSRVLPKPAFLVELLRELDGGFNLWPAWGGVAMTHMYAPNSNESPAAGIDFVDLTWLRVLCSSFFQVGDLRVRPGLSAAEMLRVCDEKVVWKNTVDISWQFWMQLNATDWFWSLTSCERHVRKTSCKVSLRGFEICLNCFYFFYPLMFLQCQLLPGFSAQKNCDATVVAVQCHKEPRPTQGDPKGSQVGR